MSNTFYIESLGCAKNQVDAELMIAQLEAEGKRRVSSPAEASLLVVNTCAFIESAKRESLEAVFELRRLYPDKHISVRGCLAERYGAELKTALPEADDFQGVPAIMAVDKRLAYIHAANWGERPLLSPAGSAYIKISEGCNNRCAFCAIPNIRGRLVSRPVKDIVIEAASLLKRGIRELVLIAQDAGSYGLDNGSGRLPDLLSAILGIDGDFWLRLLYIHPDRLLDGSLLESLIALAKSDSRFLPYFDIPFQHGSESVLRAMGRRGDAASYLRIIRRIREALPSSVLRSTFMTGFPGETDNDFSALLEFQRKAAIDWLGVFTYSREEGTPVWGMKNRVSKKTAAARRVAVEEAQIPITAARMERFTGQTMTALIEEEVSAPDTAPSVTPSERLFIGRLSIHAPEVDGAAIIESSVPLAIGSFVKVQTIGVSGFDMRCRV